MKNAGWEFVPLAEGEDAPEHLTIRMRCTNLIYQSPACISILLRDVAAGGFKLTKHEERLLEFMEPGAQFFANIMMSFALQMIDLH